MEESKRREKLEAFLLGQLEELSSALESAQTVNDVICALHSLAMLLFPVDSAAVQGFITLSFSLFLINVKQKNPAFLIFFWNSGCLDEGHRNQVRVLLFNSFGTNGVFLFSFYYFDILFPYFIYQC